MQTLVAAPLSRLPLALNYLTKKIPEKKKLVKPRPGEGKETRISENYLCDMPPDFPKDQGAKMEVVSKKYVGFPASCPMVSALDSGELIFSFFSSSLILASDHGVKGYKTQLSRSRVK